MERSQLQPVFIVGAGPGTVDYLTLKARDAIAAADVLIHDALVDPRVLAIAPTACVRIDVGKRGGGDSTPQSKIDALLVQHALAGRRVVRLKGGDPFVFGRSRSELTALQAAGCSVEVVPGVSSAIAAPALAGIPLTDPELSGSFVVLTGHDLDRHDWRAIARLDTIVVLMGARNLEGIVSRLVQHGCNERVPIAVIRECGRPEQQVWTGTLATIAEQTADIDLSPAVIAIGKVVRLHECWKQLHAPSTANLPLSGLTVLITRSEQQSDTFAQLLSDRGAGYIDLPALEIRPPSSWRALDRSIAHLSEFDWLILTSGNGVDAFWERLRKRQLDARSLAGIKIAVVGKKTAAVLRQCGLQPDFMPSKFVADALVAEFPESVIGKRILFPRVESGGREILVQELGNRGAIVTEVPAYQSGCPQAISPGALQALQQKWVDVITFASSKTVQNFCRLLLPTFETQGALNAALDGIAVAAIGPQTAWTCRSLFGRCDVEATEHTLEGLTDAIADWAARTRKHAPS
ncbi:uroporphyrin-III C-methyltransferase [Rubidibacter lacunae KORDI 51-2]|uniref:uroporphyrinogen-III C-methyltransferase n=1 Tax=Rubidibacter lacunae KORDI 51-2 TaxID=582515 RepID=U5DKB4_9CHRO|nr:uroporphyrinogen-III C-methyltransferase [Rubidibacter lacunae]ERN41019.1 uroporphyrin-III C-methyltransferase [Rubidibacter lacunae KORDI 51-2]